jgi:uncharacterized protein YbaP (TraB family)
MQLYDSSSGRPTSSLSVAIKRAAGEPPALQSCCQRLASAHRFAFADVMRRRADANAAFSLCGALAVLVLAAGCTVRGAAPDDAAVARALAACRGGQGLLFEIADPRRRDGAPLALFGSVHVGNAAMYPLSPAVEAAFEQAEGLALEVDPRLSPADADRIEVRRRLPEGVRVCDTVDPATCDQLLQTLAALQVDSASVETSKPWAVALSLEQRQFEHFGFSPQQGIELYFLRRAADHKRVVGLETIDRQIDVLDELPGDAQNALIASVAHPPAVYGQEAAQLLAAWCRGDADLLEVAFAGAPDPGPTETLLRERLIVRRNESLASAMAELMQGPERWFVAVGAAHLVGSDSIPEVLRQRGYQVRRISTVTMAPATDAGAAAH